MGVTPSNAAVAVTDLAVQRQQAVVASARRRARDLLRNPAAVFAALSLLFGSLLIALTPPLRGPDEAAHFLRAYAIARGEIVPKMADANGRKGILVPARLHDGLAFFEATHAGERKAFSDALAKARGPASPVAHHHDIRPAVLVLYEGSEGYAPVAYLAHAGAALLASAAGADFAPMLFLMRIAGLLASTAILAYAIAVVPRVLAWTFVAIAMLPAALYGRAVVSADGVAVAAAMAATAVCLRGAVQTPPHALPALAVWIALCALAKPPNIAFVVLPAMIWPLRERRALALAWAILPAVLLATLWTAMSSGEAGTWRLVELTGRPAEQFDPAWKLRFMLAQPLHFATAALAALSDIREWWRQLIGVLGLFDTVLQPWVYPALTILLAGTLLAPLHLDAGLRLRIAAVAGLTVLSYCLAVFVILYLVWTPVDASQVWGVQGRYFLPALPALAVAVAALLTRGLAPSTRAALAVCCALLSGAAAAEAVLRVDWKIF